MKLLAIDSGASDVLLGLGSLAFASVSVGTCFLWLRVLGGMVEAMKCRLSYNRCIACACVLTL